MRNYFPYKIVTFFDATTIQLRHRIEIMRGERWEELTPHTWPDLKQAENNLIKIIPMLKEEQKPDRMYDEDGNYWPDGRVE